MILVELYPPASMLLDLQARDKQSANEEMLEHLVSQGKLDQGAVKDALKAIKKRETQASTGIGKGL